jgi:ATP-dependent Clp protease ATP-binding subunit ClpA
MFEKFDTDARQTIVAAKAKALARGDHQIGAAHLLYALTVTDGVASRVLAGLGVHAATAEQALGTAGEETGGAAGAEALRAIGIDLGEVRRKAEESFGEGALDRALPGSAPRGRARRWAGERSSLDQDARTALGMSLTAARALHSGYIGTEHLLLGLVGAGERSASDVPGLLARAGLDAARVRKRVVAEMSRAAS